MTPGNPRRSPVLPSAVESPSETRANDAEGKGTHANSQGRTALAPNPCSLGGRPRGLGARALRALNPPCEGEATENHERKARAHFSRNDAVWW